MDEKMDKAKDDKLREIYEAITFVKYDNDHKVLFESFIESVGILENKKDMIDVINCIWNDDGFEKFELYIGKNITYLVALMYVLVHFERVIDMYEALNDDETNNVIANDISQIINKQVSSKCDKFIDKYKSIYSSYKTEQDLELRNIILKTICRCVVTLYTQLIG